jgi:hypothetical protein
MPRLPAAASLEAVLGFSSQLLAEITSGFTGVSNAEITSVITGVRSRGVEE